MILLRFLRFSVVFVTVVAAAIVVLFGCGWLLPLLFRLLPLLLLSLSL